jgi:hypothetical protein
VKFDRVLRTIAEALTIDTNGSSVIDLVLALRGVKAESLVGLKTPSHPEMMGDTSYVLGEPGTPELWQAIRNDTLNTYAAAHPELLNPLH